MVCFQHDFVLDFHVVCRGSCICTLKPWGQYNEGNLLNSLLHFSCPQLLEAALAEADGAIEQCQSGSWHDLAETFWACSAWYAGLKKGAMQYG